MLHGARATQSHSFHPLTIHSSICLQTHSHSTNHSLIPQNHSESPENYSHLVRSLQNCVKYFGLWMEENKLKLNNDNKTEAIRFSSSTSINTTLLHPQTIFLSNTDVELSGTVRNLGFIFDSDLSVKQHIIKTCKAAYIEIRRISSIHQYLTEDATKTLANSCILSRLDCCTSLLAGYPQSSNHSNKYRTLQLNSSLNLVEQNTPNLFSSNCTGSP